MMRALPTVSLLTLAACGGLENLPLTLGVVRGSLVGAGPGSSVSIIERPGLTSAIDVQGRFELRDVPQGPAELLVLINDQLAERLAITVHGGAVLDLGARQGRPIGTIEVELKAPSGQRVGAGSVGVDGTPVSTRFDEPGEVYLRLPAGCYTVQGTVPGLGSRSARACVDEGRKTELELRLPEPDGSPGREGCSVTGCRENLSCLPGGACAP